MPTEYPIPLPSPHDGNQPPKTEIELDLVLDQGNVEVKLDLPKGNESPIVEP